jgi:putative DNA primase/helicase
MSKTVRKNEAGLNYLDQIQAFKDEVRVRYPIDRAIEDIAGVRFVQRAGSTGRMACCPFHQEKSPSFSVNVQAGYYYCFGSGCGAKGDLFRFIMDHENVSFMEALQIAGRNAGVPFPTPDGKAPRSVPDAKLRPKRPAMATDRRLHPADLAPHGLIPVPERVRRPRPDAWASGWHEGNVNIPARLRSYRPRMVHEYRNIAGELLLSILRVELSQKKESGKTAKFFMPFRLSELPAEAPDELILNRENRTGWLVRGVPPGRLRPVYGMERVPEWRERGGGRVLIVEGEKTADAARRLLDATPDRADWVVFSPLGGANSALHADWSELANAVAAGTGPVQFVIWPDADAPILMRQTGQLVDRQNAYAMDIANGIGFALNRAGADPDRFSFSRVTPVEGVASGWDLADAEKEGWDGMRVLAKISDDPFSIRPDAAFIAVDRSAPEEADAPFPFEPDDSALEADAYEALVAVIGTQEETEMTVTADSVLPRVNPLPDADLTGAADPAVRDLKAEEVIDPAVNGDELTTDPRVVRILENRHFKCLGYMDVVSHFLSYESGQVVAISPAQMKWNYLYHLAPAAFWAANFPGPADRNGLVRTDWEAAVDALIRATNLTGQFDPESQVGLGTWEDGKKMVFNSGRGLWVEGTGPLRIDEFCGKKNYIITRHCVMPDFDNPFPAEAPEILELLKIIRSVHWAPEGRNVSVMNMFGWLAIGPICGVLPWRPHLYLSGERGVGKSWIINNIINRIFGSYAANVKADSTESGLRNILNGNAFPLIFDEAEGETPEDRQRMAKIIRLARHSATPGESFVAQGVSGGGGQRQYAIKSTFLMCSITPQLTASADFTRFGRAHVMGGLSHYDFVERLLEPAERLLTEEFSRRFMARMVIRASAMKRVSQLMYQGLAAYNMEQRLIDVYGTYLAGAWLLLRDDIPESGAAAMFWAQQTFNMVDELISQVKEVSEDKDHVRLFQTLLSSDVKVESLSLGTRTYTVGELIEMILGRYMFDDGVPTREAVRALAKTGLRLGLSARLGQKGEPLKEGDVPDCLLIHKKSPQIERILEKTPYAKSYVDVMSQAKGVRKSDKVVRFDGTSSRVLVIPLENLSLGEDVTNGRTEPARGE